MTIASRNTIRAELRKLLESESPDVSAVMRLSAQLAATDERHARFSIDAELINRLGRELVSKRETALSELVKNGYDADATRVTLTFENTNKPGGTLHLADDGSGMTRDELVEGFMRLSTDLKQRTGISRSFRRRQAGSKGIGRFAAQRLASTLILQTRSSEDHTGYELQIDWDKFQRNTELSSVPSRLTLISPQAVGTTLILENLRDSWTTDDINAAIRSLAPLVQPFPARLGHTKGVDEKSNFQIVIKRTPTSEPEYVSDVYAQFFDVALASIKAHVDGRGKAKYRLVCDRFKIDEESTLPSNYSPARAAELCAYYYTKGPSSVGKELRRVLADQGGIRVYRNGFRVLPYGEKGNDWLRLDEAYRRRDTSLLDPIGNQNFLGFVELRDADGGTFEETSSREGLIETEAFTQLRSFIFSVLRESVRKISAAKSQAAQRTQMPSGRDIRDKLRYILRHVDKYAAAPSAKTARVALEAIEPELRLVAREFRKLDAARLDELATLRILSSLGISLAEFIHEVRFSIGLISSDLSKLLRRAATDTQASDILSRLKTSAGLLRSYTDYYDEIITANEQRIIAVQEMNQVAATFEHLAKPILQSQKINLSVSVESTGKLYCRPMHGSEWSSIFLNLLSNSIKAIRRKGGDGKVFVEINTDSRHVIVNFLDNGDGIPRDRWEDVFLPFYSSTATSGRESEPDLAGMGMGLKIVKDIVEANNGTIGIVDPPQLWSTSIQIAMPLATKAQIESADD